MMSVAIPMMAGVEQTKVSPMPGDLLSGSGELKDVSFAESLSERVGLPIFSDGNGTAENLANTLPSLKGTTVTKTLEEAADKSFGVKEKSRAVQEITVEGELKDAVPAKNIRLQATNVARSHDKIAADDSGATQVEFSAQVEGTADDISSIPSAAGSATSPVSPRSPASIADGEQPSTPLVLNGGAPPLQRETKVAEKVPESASSKKIAKAQESSATQKTVQKAVGKIIDAIAVEPKPVTGVSTESASPVVTQVVAPTVALRGEVSEAPGGVSKAVFSMAKPITADGQARKETASGPKASGTDFAVTVTAENDPAASPKQYLSPEKMPAVAMPDGNDGEKKMQGIRESGSDLLNSMGMVPTVGVSGNTPAEVAPAKMVVGEAGFHTEASLTGLRAQDEAGVVAQSIDGAPRMLASTPTSLEIGIQNGTHGWLKVRAEMSDGGVVNASVSATSSAGQDMLHRELPGMTAFLQEEKVAVNTVVVHPASAAAADARSFSGTDATGGQTSRGSNQGEDQQNLRRAALNSSDETMASRNAQGSGGDGSLPLAVYGRGGSWLNVRA